MIIIIFLSFLLEGIFTNLININSYFLPLFTITSLVITYPYFNKEKKYFFVIVATVIGIIYDIAYTNSLFINTFTFSICSILIILIDNYIPNSFIGKMSINVFMVISFRFISYLLLFCFEFIQFNSNILLKGILSSLILNIFYSIFLYYICIRIKRIKK